MTNSIDHNSGAFSDRRSRLMQSLHGGAIIMASGHNSPRNNDVDYEFRQNSSFWYLTGFEEPDSVAVLRPGCPDEYTLFLQPYDPQFEIWVGHRVGIEGAAALGVNRALPISELEDQLPKLLEDIDTVYYSIGSDAVLDTFVTNLVQKRRSLSQRGGTPLLTIYDPIPSIDNMRLIKSNSEIESLQSAIDITNRGFEAAMNVTKPGIYEYQVQSEMESHFRRLGSERNGYPSKFFC